MADPSPPAIYLALKAELAAPAYSGKSDIDAADLLNQPGSPLPGVVTPNQLLIWGASTGARKRIEDGKAGSPALAALCYAITDMLGTGSIGLDCGNVANQGMLAQLVAAGICTQAQSDALVSMAAIPGPSRARIVFGVPVSALDVAHARSL